MKRAAVLALLFTAATFGMGVAHADATTGDSDTPCYRGGYLLPDAFAFARQ